MSLKKWLVVLALVSGAALVLPDLFVPTVAAAPLTELAKLDNGATRHAKGKHHKHNKHHKHHKGGKKKK